jgi:hydroxymethylbilane synthase
LCAETETRPDPVSVPEGHGRALPLRVGTRASPLALWQTRHFLSIVTRFCPVLREAGAFQEHPIRTTGDRVQDRRLAEIGGKGSSPRRSTRRCWTAGWTSPSTA